MIIHELNISNINPPEINLNTDKRLPIIKDFVPLADLYNLVFGDWDILEDNMYAVAVKAGTLKEKN